MKLAWIRILFISLSCSVLASDYVSGQAVYKMQPKETLGFAKSYLHYQAYRNVLTKELNNLGLDATSFWKKYDESFEKSFEQHQERYDKAIAAAKTVDAKQQTQFSLKDFKLRKQKAFAGMSHVVISDAIKSFGSKFGDPKTRTMTIDAKLNYKALRKIYSRFMIDSLKTKSFNQVVIKPNFDWGNIDFSKVGEQSKVEIEALIIKGWKEWFAQNTNPEKPIQAFDEQEAATQPNLSRASLFIGVRARADEDKSDAVPVHYQFSIALRDDKTEDFIFFKDISEVLKFYPIPTDESRRMTNDIWATPIPHFVTLRSLLERSILTENTTKVFIRNYKHIDDILKIQDRLKTIGIGINLLSDIDYFQSSTARLIMRYNGDVKRLASVLKAVQNDFFPVELVIEDQENVVDSKTEEAKASSENIQ